MVSSRSALLDDDNDRKDYRYPRLLPISLSHAEFPATYDMMQKAGSTFGCIVRPFIQDFTVHRDYSKSQRSGLNLARCNSCAAYISPLSEPKLTYWYCALCGSKNPFPRKLPRYRNADLQLVPELQEVLFDYRVPLFDHREGQNPLLQNIEAIPVTKRPYVHVFLVQESMRIDTMQATVEALSAAIRDLHPQTQVVLLTFSHRIGIYCLSRGATVPTVQYVHFTECPAEGAHGHIYEAENVQNQAQIQQTKALIPLSQVADFLEVAKPIEHCRDAFLSAVSSLFDAYGASNDSFSDDGSCPRVMLGPAVDAIGEWIIEPASNSVSSVVASTVESGQKTSLDGNGGLTGLLGDISLGIWSAVAGAGISVGLTTDSPSTSSSSNCSVDDVLKRKPNQGCIDHCTGVMLHIFLDAPQDTPMGSHKSVCMMEQQLPNYSGDKRYVSSDRIVTSVDKEWVYAKAQYFANCSLCVNMWALVSFEGQQSLNLSTLDTLPQLTGGKTRRFVLGIHPRGEQHRFAEELRRALCVAYATRGVLRMRTSRSLDVVEDGATGLMIPDKHLPGVFRLPTACPDTALGFELKYNSKNSSDNEEMEVVVLQLAYSYETLVTEEELQRPEHIRYDSYSDMIYALDSARDVDDADIFSSYCRSAAHALGLEKVYTAANRLFVRRFTEQMTPHYYRHELKLRASRMLPPLFEVDAMSRRPSSFPMRDVEVESSSPLEVTARSAMGGEHSDTAWTRQHQRLYAVRRLRLFTAYTECSKKLSRMQQVVHIPTVMSLLMRKALMEERRLLWNESYSQFQSTISADSDNFQQRVSLHTPGVKLLVNAAIEMVLSATKLYLHSVSSKSNAVQCEPTKRQPEAPTGPLSAEQVVQAVIHSPTIRDQLICIFAAIDRIVELIQHPSLQLIQHDAAGDQLAEFDSMVQNSDGHVICKMLYPLLTTVSTNLLMGEQFLPLSRTSIVASTHRYFYLDAGTDILFYSTAAAVTSGGKENSIAKDFQHLEIANQDSPKKERPEHQIAGSREEQDSSHSEPARRQQDALFHPQRQLDDHCANEIAVIPAATSLRNSNDSMTLDEVSEKDEFLLTYLQRRLKCSDIVPRVMASAAGTASASAVSDHLLEDSTRSGISFPSFVSFVSKIVSKACEE